MHTLNFKATPKRPLGITLDQKGDQKSLQKQKNDYTDQ